MEDSIDAFIRFLAVERGLSENYQLSTQQIADRIRAMVQCEEKNHSPARRDPADDE